jgi:hypothetical protein
MKLWIRMLLSTAILFLRAQIGREEKNCGAQQHPDPEFHARISSV